MVVNTNCMQNILKCYIFSIQRKMLKSSSKSKTIKKENDKSHFVNGSYILTYTLFHKHKIQKKKSFSYVINGS